MGSWTGTQAPWAGFSYWRLPQGSSLAGNSRPRRRANNVPAHDFRFRRLPGEDLIRTWAVRSLFRRGCKEASSGERVKGAWQRLFWGFTFPKLSPVGIFRRGIRVSESVYCSNTPFSTWLVAFKHLDTILFYHSHSGSLYLYRLVKVPYFSHSSCLPLKKDLVHYFDSRDTFFNDYQVPLGSKTQNFF